MPDMFGLADGLGPDEKNREGIICERFIKKVSQMDGNQLARFLADYHYETVCPCLALTFKIPFRTDYIEAFLRDTKRDGMAEKIKAPPGGQDREAAGKATALAEAIHGILLKQLEEYEIRRNMFKEA